MSESTATTTATATATEREKRETGAVHEMLLAGAEALKAGMSPAELADLFEHAAVMPVRGQAAMCDAVTAHLRDGKDLPEPAKANAQYKIVVAFVRSMRAGTPAERLIEFMTAAGMSDTSQQASFFTVIISLLDAVTPMAPAESGK